MYPRMWQQTQSVKTQEQSQQWFSLGHSTAPKFWRPGEGSRVPPGSGLIPCLVKGTGEQCFLLQRESSGLTWLLLARAGFRSLHVICPIFTYLSPADPRGSPSSREGETSSCDLRQQSKVGMPKGETPADPTSPREDPRCLPGDRDLPPLVLPFSCVDV